MAEIIKFPARHDANSPGLRAAVLALVLQHVASVPAPVTYSAVFYSAMEAINRPEEECSAEIMAATLLLAKAGLIVCNTYEDSCLTISAETVLTASPQLTGWIWRDPETDEGDSHEGEE